MKKKALDLQRLFRVRVRNRPRREKELFCRKILTTCLYYSTLRCVMMESQRQYHAKKQQAVELFFHGLRC